MASEVFVLLFKWRVTTGTGRAKVVSEAKQASAWSSASLQVELRSLKVNRVCVHVNTPGQAIQPGGSLGETTRKESSEELKK